MNAHLFALAFRRSLPPGLLVFALAVLLLAGGVQTSAGIEALGVTSEDAARGLARQGVWIGASLLLLPVLVFRAAGTVAAWRRGEIDWLAASAAGRATLLASTWSGTALGGTLLIAAIGLAAELTTGAGSATARLVERRAVPRVLLDQSGARTPWTYEDLPAAGEVRVNVFLVTGGPSADVRMTVERAAGERQRTEVLARVAGRTELRAPIPDGDGPVEVALERVGAGAVVALDPRGLDVLATSAREWHASVALFVSGGLALAAWLALGLGLGAWISSPSAAAVVASVTLLTWSRGIPGLPWSHLPDSFGLVGQRLVPATSLATAAPATLALVLAGLAIGCAGLRTWRQTP